MHYIHLLTFRDVLFSVSGAHGGQRVMLPLEDESGVC